MANQRDQEGNEVGKGKWEPRYCSKETYDYLMSQMPKGAVPADMTRQAPYNSYGPKCWYQDFEFTCRDCGSAQVWTAQQQKWWYEEAKGPIDAVAIRCRSCREALRERHQGTPRRSQADRNA